MDGYVENGDVSGGYGSMNINNIYQKNCFKPLINYNNSDDIDMNDYLKNGDVSCGICLINSHNLYQCN